ncbi:TetR family transcriptional regulator C-terminal domain-containing protein [Pseudomonas yamanorum]|uniref:TetR family transcriptional regulator C-terminal domain-containing protein n=1 Tax=Pseudomonas yamanorum TaxID=515393 RepID=A0A7Y8K6Q1_9PSED|nr:MULTISPECIES: TetR/AcrR family transcriptional regulator [Pseudomonas]NWE41171.1 TetR family transcriptional regulator C-terminal domain-containing protein [Pseudomonas yamanorum]NWE78117.1 TetR family transcriptional regulator C-terminal domain-containing protein [Pseudomonas yamanorum]
MGRPSRKDELLAAGIAVLHRQGYAGSSVDAIVEEAGMQKGSFFGHFGSKEAFASEALKGYFKGWTGNAEAILANPDLNNRAKLEALVRISTPGDCETYGYGCLIGNLAAEMSMRHDDVRNTLVDILAEWTRPFAQLVREGVASGEFRAGLEPEATARFLINALQGSVLRGKVDRTTEPYEDFLALASTLLLADA